MSFFNRLDKFSFKDSIAIAFIGIFFYFCFERDTAMVSALLPPIMLILGAYFAQEGYSGYLDRKIGGNTDEQSAGTSASGSADKSTPIS